jgi:methylation protein EvaC
MVKNKSCRLCGSELKMVIDFGKLPLAGNFLKKSQLGKEKKYQLRIYFCKRCMYLEVADSIKPDILFKNYHYITGINLKDHFGKFAEEISRKFIKKGDLVLEIGSNDGTLLMALEKNGVKVLGVDPSSVAANAKVPTINKYFGRRVSEEIVRKTGKAKVVTASNVLAHIDNMGDILKGITNVLKEDGTLIFEVHYLLDLIKKSQYDFFYHEHLSYYSIKSLRDFLKKHGLAIFDIRKTKVHGGSIRVYAYTGKENTKKVNELIKKEMVAGLDNISTYKELDKEIKNNKKKVLEFIAKSKKNRQKIIGYGASGRANTLLSVWGLKPDDLEFIVDESPLRYGYYTPGSHIKIISPREFLRTEGAALCILFAHAYRKQIFTKEKKFLRSGGVFIHPLTVRKIAS